MTLHLCVLCSQQEHAGLPALSMPCGRLLVNSGRELCCPACIRKWEKDKNTHRRYCSKQPVLSHTFGIGPNVPCTLCIALYCTSLLFVLSSLIFSFSLFFSAFGRSDQSVWDSGLILGSVSFFLSFCCFIKSWLQYPGFEESLLFAVQTAFVIFFMLHFQ